MNLKAEKPAGAVHTHATAEVQEIRMILPGYGFKPYQGIRMVKTTVYTVHRSNPTEDAK